MFRWETLWVVFYNEMLRVIKKKVMYLYIDIFKSPNSVFIVNSLGYNNTVTTVGYNDSLQKEFLLVTMLLVERLMYINA